MARRLPPLNAVRAFEAAARHESFLRAAQELGVTPGAVSHQVKLLERFLNVSLFLRKHRGLSLTDPGSSYLLRVRDALDRLAAATDQITASGDSRLLRITALPALAEKWLAPRLRNFQESHPGIRVRLSADAEVVDFVNRDFDVGLRYTDGHHPELWVHRLFEDELFPVCSPAPTLSAGRRISPAKRCFMTSIGRTTGGSG